VQVSRSSGRSLPSTKRPQRSAASSSRTQSSAYASTSSTAWTWVSKPKHPTKKSLKLSYNASLFSDWEFPEARDKEGFTQLVKDFRIEFQNEAVLSNRPRLLLTAAVAVWRPKVEAGYEPGKISQYLDFINLMAYDYHGSWNKNTGHNSPLFARQGQTGDQLLLNQEASINAWIELGAEPEKLVLGLAMYGRTFTLKTKTKNGMDAPSKNAGKLTRLSPKISLL